MTDTNSKQYIIDNLPELTDEDYQEINALFPAYLFFKNKPQEGYIECCCSACREHFFYEYTQRTETPQHYDFLQIQHNHKIVCPECGKTVIAKEMGKAKQCISLAAWRRTVIIKRISENEVFLIAYECKKDYSYYHYLIKPECHLTAVYILKPNLIRTIFKGWYDYWETVEIKEPFYNGLGSNTVNMEERMYRLIGTDRLKDTFLKYAPIELFHEKYIRWYYGRNAGYYLAADTGIVPFAKFLCYYTLYPSTEKLLKIDLSDFVCKLVDGKPMKRYVDWDAEKPHEMFKMNRTQFKDFREHYYGEIDFKVYQNLKKVKENISYSFVTEIVKNYRGVSAERVSVTIKKHKLNITRTFNYLEKIVSSEILKMCKPPYIPQVYENIAIQWVDYLDFAKELKYDLSRDDVIYPKNLIDAHDKATANIMVVRDEKAKIKYQTRYEKLQKQYEYSNGEYQIVVPQGVDDIVAEGSALCHCVKGYAERHMEGKTTILFMRRCNCPNTRLITIEINGKNIVQNRGMKNRAPTKEEQAFIDKWVTWVKAGSKRPKKKKTASAA